MGKDSVTVSVEVDDREFARAMKGAEKQIPFAVANALTQTAKDAQKRVRGLLPASFTVRSAYVANGIRIGPAKKGALVATVGSISPFMGDHAEGGTKTTAKGGDVAVPVGARANKRDRTRLSSFPSKLIANKKKRVLMNLRTGQPISVRGRPGIWVRRSRERKDIWLMWWLRPKVAIQKDWPFEEQVRRAVGMTWETWATRAIQRALSTGRY